MKLWSFSTIFDQNWLFRRVIILLFVVSFDQFFIGLFENWLISKSGIINTFLQSRSQQSGKKQISWTSGGLRFPYCSPVCKHLFWVKKIKISVNFEAFHLKNLKQSKIFEKSTWEIELKFRILSFEIKS